MAIKIGKTEWPNIRTLLADLIGAASLFVLFFGAIWVYFIVTGEPVTFGGGNGG